MAGEVLNATGLLSPEIFGRLDFLITILQAVGWFIIFYIIFNIINTLIIRKRNKKIDEVLGTLKEIKQILKKQSKKR